MDKYPWLALLPTQTMKWLKDLKVRGENWFDKQLDRKYDTYREEETSGVLDDLIKEIEEKKTGDEKPFTRDNIDGVARDLIGAGQ